MPQRLGDAATGQRPQTKDRVTPDEVPDGVPTAGPTPASSWLRLDAAGHALNSHRRQGAATAVMVVIGTGRTGGPGPASAPGRTKRRRREPRNPAHPPLGAPPTRPPPP